MMYFRRNHRQHNKNKVSEGGGKGFLESGHRGSDLSPPSNRQNN